MSPRVLLADDHAVVREGIRDRLIADGLDVVGEAANGEDALRLALALLPDVLVLDMEMPLLSGVDVARRLRDAGVPVRVLVLSAYDDDSYIAEVLASGAAGYLTKEESLNTIVAAVRGVARGESGWLSRSVAARMMQLRTAPAVAAPERVVADGGLTEREVEVLACVARGRTNGQVADVLSISEHTVRNHLASVYDKLGVHNRAEAVAWAWEHGVLRADG